MGALEAAGLAGSWAGYGCSAVMRRVASQYSADSCFAAGSFAVPVVAVVPSAAAALAVAACGEAGLQRQLEIDPSDVLTRGSCQLETACPSYCPGVDSASLGVGQLAVVAASAGA